MAKASVGGNPNEPAWVKQKGQCSEWTAVPAGAVGVAGILALALLFDLAPATEQISVQKRLEPLLEAIAYEMDGASRDMRTAKLAIQAVKRRVA
jgi:hypothetical protein